MIMIMMIIIIISQQVKSLNYSKIPEIPNNSIVKSTQKKLQQMQKSNPFNISKCKTNSLQNPSITRKKKYIKFQTHHITSQTYREGKEK